MFTDPQAHRLLAEERAADLRRASSQPLVAESMLRTAIAALTTRIAGSRHHDCFEDPATAGFPR